MLTLNFKKSISGLDIKTHYCSALATIKCDKTIVCKKTKNKHTNGPLLSINSLLQSPTALFGNECERHLRAEKTPNGKCMFWERLVRLTVAEPWRTQLKKICPRLLDLESICSRWTPTQARCPASKRCCQHSWNASCPIITLAQNSPLYNIHWTVTDASGTIAELALFN